MLSSFFFFCGDNRNEPYIFCLCIACRLMCACVLGLGTLPSSSTPGYGQSSLWCNSPAWWLHPWGSGSAGCSSLAWWAQCWITALSVYVLNTCSCPIEKEFHQDCEIKHMSEEVPGHWFSHLLVHMYYESAINYTVTHCFFHRIPASLCAQDVHCCSNKKPFNIFSHYCFSWQAMRAELLMASWF